MAEPVRCDVCGKLVNSSYLRSHKRLAHPSATESTGEQKIVELFKTLSPEDQQKVVGHLSALLGKQK